MSAPTPGGEPTDGPHWSRGGPQQLPDRAVFVAPHPDDEVLGFAGSLRWLRDRGVPCQLVAVTDGEASHARSDRVTPAALVRTRLAERAAALAALDLAELPVRRLRLPDGAVADHADGLARSLAEGLGPGTALVLPWRGDRHPDHRAVACAGLDAARRRGARPWEVPIWGRVHGVTEPASVLQLGSHLARKARAVEAFASQLHPLGPGPHDGPVLRPFELEAMVRPDELVILR